MQSPPDPRLKRPPLVNVGCALGVIGLGALAIGMLVRLISGHPSTATKILAGGGVVLALLALFGIATYTTFRSAAQSRRISGRWPIGDAPAAIAAVRDIESVSNPARGKHPEFPRGLVVNAVIALPTGPPGGQLQLTSAGYAVTKSNLWTRNSRLKAPSWGYVWINLPQALPTLVLSANLPGASPVSSDVDIESGDFNRRFRVTDSMPGAPSTGIDHAQFARYATAILHPRAVEAVMATPNTWMIAIHGHRIGAQVSPLFAGEDIERLAYSLGAVASLIPRFVWDSNGRRSPYPPHR
ncbi:hypothetical protein CLV47_102211 [Antricoccus suffuscus]|uniref:Uncharacterized protein n=1 Tax=Antricoccus suffuscus TaxID=1629062 RepID=A0A2T1A4K0_9ACTN|nr:hypothetical protein [Antricoccus suffuscus]PRZ43523.1 hypothetical protein CLV47_102211 [Antricoccus suffuscus]